MKEDRAWPKMSIRQLHRDACLIRSQFQHWLSLSKNCRWQGVLVMWISTFRPTGHRSQAGDCNEQDMIFICKHYVEK